MTSVLQLAAQPAIMTLQTALNTRLDRIIEEAIHIQQIPAPTFDESRRAAYVLERFGPLDTVETDALNNVYGRLPGKDPTLPAVLLSAHTDTVFDADTPLGIHRQNGRIYGPGLGDNSLGVAALLAIMDLLREYDERLPVDIWFVANSREEGMGDLGGIRAVYEKLASRISSALVIEGMAFGRIYHEGIAVRRLRISCKTPGGHSWLHFGRPNAIHGLVRLGAQITSLQPPDSPRTTYNIGVIEGGQSVNSIAADASMLLDLRSEDRDTLARLERAVMLMIDNSRRPDMEFTVDIVGDRPAGAIPVTHPLVGLARDVLNSLNVRPVYEAGSTDANALLAAGLPTVTVGVTFGGNAHRLDEYIETAQIRDGLWQLLLLTIAIASQSDGETTGP